MSRNMRLVKTADGLADVRAVGADGIFHEWRSIWSVVAIILTKGRSLADLDYSDGVKYDEVHLPTGKLSVDGTCIGLRHSGDMEIPSRKPLTISTGLDFRAQVENMIQMVSRGGKQKPEEMQPSAERNVVWLAPSTRTRRRAQRSSWMQTVYRRRI